MSTREPSPCEICGRVYRKDLIEKCPGCRANEMYPTGPVKYTHIVIQEENSSLAKQQSTDALSTSANSNLEIIKAVDRTTHAVRAFVLFLFYQLSSITAAVFFYLVAEAVGNSNDECEYTLRSFGGCPPNSFFLVLAVVTWLGGVIYSSNVGWKEIQKSNL
jgi:hypothetical protein